MGTPIIRVRQVWRRIPARTRLGLLVAVIAITGLTWQHHNAENTTTAAHINHDDAPTTALQDGNEHPEGHAVGEYQPDPDLLPPPPDFTTDAARSDVARFAANFASPNNNRDDWLARLSPDVLPELLAQYQLTDLRNLPHTTVAQISGPTTTDPAAPSFHVTYTDGSAIAVTVEMTVTGWKVSTVIPLDTAAHDAEQDHP